MNPVRGCGGRTLPRAGPFLEEKSILSVTQRAKTFRESKGSSSKVPFFAWQKSILPHTCIRNVEDAIYVLAGKSKRNRATRFSQFIKEKLRKY